MHKFYKILFVLFLITGTSQLSFAQTNRKKVAVVLSGGGAKGTAHVRALKVIEEAGIPIDMVVGTSMGSIVGGLYAAGYSTHQMDSLVRSQDWITLLTDADSRTGTSLSKKLNNDRYILNATFNKKPTEIISGGILKGNKIGKLFSELTSDYPDSIDFNKLPIPFACVAVDLVKNEEVDFHSGILAECMRCSMSIPGVFAPVKKNGRVYVDGGLANNFPVDVAKKMGADYVIGVSVGGDKKTADDLNTTADILMQIIDVVCDNKYEENLKQTDVFIKVDVKGYSSASFTKNAIDSLMVRGEKAARDKWDELVSLRNELGLTKPVAIRQDKRVSPQVADVVPVSTIYQDNSKNSQISFGARYDTEEMASVLIGGSYELPTRSDMYAALEIRLGKRSYGKLSFSLNPFEKWQLTTSYQFISNEIKFNDSGSKAGVLDFTEHHGIFNLSRSWREVLVSGGIDFTYRHFNDFMASSKWIIITGDQPKNEKSLGYYASMQFNNQDSKILPRKGMSWFLKYTFFTDNGLTYEHEAGMHIIEGSWNAALPLAKNFTLHPSVSGRLLPMRNNQMGNYNYIGGFGLEGHYMPQQLSFAGVNFMEMVPYKVLIVGLTGRHWLSANNYLFCASNYGFLGNDMDDFVNTRNIFGAALGMGYKTAIGPVEANFNWSTLTKKVAFFLNIGYTF